MQSFLLALITVRTIPTNANQVDYWLKVKLALLGIVILCISLVIFPVEKTEESSSNQPSPKIEPPKIQQPPKVEAVPVLITREPEQPKELAKIITIVPQEPKQEPKPTGLYVGDDAE